MIEITAEIRALIDKAAAGVELAEDEYIDLSDGLIHCKKCGGQRQTVVPCFGKPGYFMPRCICQCQREAEEQRKAAEERQRRMERIKRRKAQGLQDRYLYDYTFANDNGQNPLMEKARAYVENWKEAYRNNTGLLLFGDVGTGKSFFAGCIANALLDRDVPVLMTNFPTILNRLTGMFSEDRADFIASFDEYDLLIIDDLGVERSTEYAMEQMFFVIDSRYRSRRPMIITTNLKLSELKNPPDLAHARIYDRILERCAPILFDGKNFREENAGATRQTAKDIVSSKSSLKNDDEMFWYFVIRFMAATGARVSELIQIKAEHVKLGHLDLYSKGGKLRRIYMPKELQKEALSWLAEKHQESGFIFLNKYGERITTRGISGQLKKLAVKYGINPAVVYPHSFRHRFAKSFLERCNDIAFLADLMGHESIETTRIYLRKTATEQREIVDTIIDW